LDNPETICLVAGFVMMNVVAFMHAYTFTHFDKDITQRTQDPDDLSAVARIGLLFTGIDNPRPANKKIPSGDFETVKIESSGTLDCWFVKSDLAIGTMIMFHGYAGEKSSLLERAAEFQKLRYNILFVDFLGSGGSTGNSTSIGHSEAAQVNACFNFVKTNYPGEVAMFGTSMGAAAILKAMNDHTIDASAIILECPFGSLYETVAARFHMMNVPAFPMAALLCFWGGAQHGYWAFGHNPSEYAKSVSCPTLLLYGQMDERVSQEETDAIFRNLPDRKKLVNYPNAGHDVFSEDNRPNWIRDVTGFVDEL
jgi:uncharacterized protein